MKRKTAQKNKNSSSKKAKIDKSEKKAIPDKKVKTTVKDKEISGEISDQDQVVATSSQKFVPQKSPSGKEWNTKLISWNINGIRAWLKHATSVKFVTDEQADVMGVQEIKCASDKMPPESNIPGFQSTYSPADKEGYAGTGIFSKLKPIKITHGIGKEKHDSEGRVMTAEFEKFFFVTAYVPNAGRGLPRLPYRQKEWDPDFADYLKKLDKQKPIIVCGDLNVAHLEIDLENPKTNKKTAGFTDEEREGFSKLLESVDLVDTFRHLYPDKTKAYTFWSYMGNARGKNIGWRLDYFLISRRLLPNLCDHEIKSDIKGSDHCPIALYMHF